MMDTPGTLQKHPTSSPLTAETCQPTGSLSLPRALHSATTLHTHMYMPSWDWYKLQQLLIAETLSNEPLYLRQTHFYNFFGCLLRIAKPPHAIKATWKPPSNTHSSWKCIVICKFIYIKRISTFFIAVVTKHRVILHLFASLLRNQYIHIHVFCQPYSQYPAQAEK